MRVPQTFFFPLVKIAPDGLVAFLLIFVNSLVACSANSLVSLVELAPDGQVAPHLILIFFLLRRMARSLLGWCRMARSPPFSSCRDSAGWPGRFPSSSCLLEIASDGQIASLALVVSSSGSTWLWLFGRSFRYVRCGTCVPVHQCSGATLQSISIGNLLWLVVSSLEATGACYLVSVPTDNFFIMLDLSIKH